VRVRAKAPHQSFAVAVRGQPMCFGFAVDAFAGARVRRELMIACVVAGWKKYFQKTFGLEIVYPYSFCSLSGGYRKKILRKFVRLRVGSDDISLTALSKGGGVNQSSEKGSVFELDRHTDYRRTECL
jgi:hypothetical protein